MNKYKTIWHKRDCSNITVFFIVLAMLFFATSVFSHGGKTHSDKSFTPLHALQKATILFDRLVETNKLDEDWETELITVVIKTKKIGNIEELYVSFKKASGNPHTVYIFFDSEGEYAGSNFTGD